ncbi:MAG: hypothetical protein R3F39_18140 [Myxococcota bacterium]
MTTIRNIFVLSIAVASLAFAGCGDDEVSAASAKRFCKATCEKSTSCVSSPIAIDCDSQCSVTTGGSGNTNCDVSSSQVDQCASDFEKLSCDDFKAGKTPSSCDFCPNSSTPDTTSTPDSSGDTGTTFPDVSSGTATCADLAECCAKISDANVKMGCEGLVAQGIDANCSAGLDSYKLVFCK